MKFVSFDTHNISYKVLLTCTIYIHISQIVFDVSYAMPSTLLHPFAMSTSHMDGGRDDVSASLILLATHLSLHPTFLPLSMT